MDRVAAANHWSVVGLCGVRMDCVCVSLDKYKSVTVRVWKRNERGTDWTEGGGGWGRGEGDPQQQ